ncbi:hypothetical protein HBI81_016670 [Parastagonospora nodorum]|nr:hypothetical protein HBH53_000760 [Parastagonospora nodorum]KAH4102486.1 hypothetical protein HBH46_126860 [Parastagonospora nodorum]KAH4214471.1 hypothetical protein HBI95_008480 [Parastagonospora nodorum]KAH5369969.1 hypothetical protein HBI48_042360 [Parastagonospora nodorum]KAH5453831.1 hypothetical protein HBI47_006560 [Parastagonospora nodorum]
MSIALRHASTLAGHIALNPIVTSALLWILTKAPVSVRARLTDRIAILRDPRRVEQIVKALKWCLAFGVTGAVNRKLNQVALNGGRWGSETAKWDWSKEVAVVTGGCSGIGALVVKGLVGRGVKVAVLDVNDLPANMQGYAHIKFFRCDVTDPDAVYATAGEIKISLGAPSILINNAGILGTHTILATPDAFLKKIFEINVLSNWYTTKAFLPSMIAANKGHIVTIASAASFIGVAGLADYTATKAAILSFHEGLAQEIKHHYKAPNVLTTSVHPNWVRTPLLGPVEEELKSRGSEILEPQYVADRVVQSVLSCRGGQVVLPEAAGKVAMLRGLPNWMQEKIRDGVSQTILRSAAVKE